MQGSISNRITRCYACYAPQHTYARPSEWELLGLDVRARGLGLGSPFEVPEALFVLLESGFVAIQRRPQVRFGFPHGQAQRTERCLAVPGEVIGELVGHCAALPRVC